MRRDMNLSAEEGPGCPAETVSPVEFGGNAPRMQDSGRL